MVKERRELLHRDLGGVRRVVFFAGQVHVDGRYKRAVGDRDCLDEFVHYLFRVAGLALVEFGPLAAREFFDGVSNETTKFKIGEDLNAGRVVDFDIVAVFDFIEKTRGRRNFQLFKAPHIKRLSEIKLKLFLTASLLK